MKKILYVTGTRADYGLMRSVLKNIDEHPNLELEIVATGMHIMKEFGNTVDEIKKDGFKTHIIEATYDEDTKESMVNFIGKTIQLFTKIFLKINPDIILVLGDRGEMLAGTIVGAYLTIPVAHVHGGEVTSTIDESTRHAITKFSHIHFPATKKGAERIIRMGEDPSRVFIVGAPGLDAILKDDFAIPKELSKKYKFDILKPIILVVQHPVTNEYELAAKQMHETLEAISELKHKTILIYPNADAGGRKMIKVIEKYKKYPFILPFKNIPHRDFLGLMNIASVLVGNSSSGIVEAPSFGLPVVNIGTRQEGRERAENIIDTDYKKEQIICAINKAINDEEFIKNVKKCRNPYASENTGKKIAEILSNIYIDNNLLQKKIMY